MEIEPKNSKDNIIKNCIDGYEREILSAIEIINTKYKKSIKINDIVCDEFNKDFKIYCLLEGLNDDTVKELVKNDVYYNRKVYNNSFFYDKKEMEDICNNPLSPFVIHSKLSLINNPTNEKAVSDFKVLYKKFITESDGISKFYDCDIRNEFKLYKGEHIDMDEAENFPNDPIIDFTNMAKKGPGEHTDESLAGLLKQYNNGKEFAYDEHYSMTKDEPSIVIEYDLFSQNKDYDSASILSLH